jgi:hypothetical protein
MKLEMTVVESSDIKHALQSRRETALRRSEQWSGRDERLASFYRDEVERLEAIIERIEAAFNEWLVS